MSHGKRIGELAELQFQVTATREGCIVSKPLGDNQSYDYIVEKGGFLRKVQIKSTAKAYMHKNKYPRYEFKLTRGSAKTKTYQPNEVDIFALYLHDQDVWYLIPYDYIKGVMTVNIYAKTEKDKFKEFRNNWNL